MADLVLWNIQQALVQRLNSDEGFRQLATVYDDVPRGLLTAYVKIGDFYRQAADTFDSRGWSILYTFHIWTPPGGNKLAFMVASEMNRLLDRQKLPLPDGAYATFVYEDDRPLADPSGWRHLIVRYRIYYTDV